MDRKQQNRYDMFIATHRFLQEHQSAWANDAMMLAAAAKLRSLIDTFAVTNGSVVNASGPAVRMQREEALTTAIDALSELAAVTANWAAGIPGETVLYQLVSTMGYKLRNMSLANRLERMKAMLDACEAAAPGIPDNPLSAEAYRNARACLNIYVDLDGAARNNDAQRIAAVVQLTELIDEAAALLKRIDGLLRKFQTKQPELYMQYKAVRKVLDRGGHTKRSGNKALKKAEQAAKKAQDAALLAAETARIADEDAKNRAAVSELKKSFGKTATKANSNKGAEDTTVPVIQLPPADPVQVG